MIDGIIDGRLLRFKMVAGALRGLNEWMEDIEATQDELPPEWAATREAFDRCLDEFDAAHNIVKRDEET